MVAWRPWLHDSKRYCTGCGKVHDAALFEYNQSSCRESKRVMDCIYGMAKRQGALSEHAACTQR
eukprot:1678873-Alexandrium_andersonii.AAC.1